MIMGFNVKQDRFAYGFKTPLKIANNCHYSAEDKRGRWTTICVSITIYDSPLFVVKCYNTDPKSFTNIYRQCPIFLPITKNIL